MGYGSPTLHPDAHTAAATGQEYKLGKGTWKQANIALLTKGTMCHTMATK